MDPIVTRTYKGKKADATAAFTRDAAMMAESGYYAISKSWAPGSKRSLSFLASVLGTAFAHWDFPEWPAGTLTVMYQWRAPRNTPAFLGD
jgi:hypothetical protein